MPMRVRMSYSTVGLRIRDALAATGQFERVAIRRGRRWDDWSLLVTMGGVETELAFAGWQLCAEREEPIPHLRLVSQRSEDATS